MKMHSFLVVSRLFVLEWIGQKKNVLFCFVCCVGRGGACHNFRVFSIGHGLDRFNIKQW